MSAVIDETTGREVILTDAFSYNGTYNVKATGYSGTATAGTTTNIDFAVGAEDRYINGTMLLLKNHAWGDTVDLKVVDVNNVMGYGAGVVLNQFGYTWNINDQVQQQGVTNFNYVARLYAGLYIRIVYTSVGGTNVDVKLNCFMHKKMI